MMIIQRISLKCAVIAFVLTAALSLFFSLIVPADASGRILSIFLLEAYADEPMSGLTSELASQVSDTASKASNTASQVSDTASQVSDTASQVSDTESSNTASDTESYSAKDSNNGSVGRQDLNADGSASDLPDGQKNLSDNNNIKDQNSENNSSDNQKDSEGSSTKGSSTKDQKDSVDNTIDDQKDSEGDAADDQKNSEGDGSEGQKDTEGKTAEDQNNTADNTTDTSDGQKKPYKYELDDPQESADEYGGIIVDVEPAYDDSVVMRGYKKKKAKAKAGAPLYVMIGDSYGTQKPYLADEIAKALGLSKKGGDYYCSFCGSYSIGRINANRTYLRLLNQLPSNKNVTDVLLYGGIYNDRNTRRYIIERCMTELAQHIREKYPNARILYATGSWSANTKKRSGQKFSIWYQNLIDTRLPWYKEACEANDIIFLEEVPNALRARNNQKYFKKDGHHPSKAGIKQIAKVIAKSIRKLDKNKT